MSSHDQIVHQLIWRNCQDAWKTDDRLSGRLTYRVIDLPLCINIGNSIQNESWRIPNMKEEDPFHKCYINLAPLKWSSLRRRYANKKFHGKRGLFPHICWDVTLIFISGVKLKKSNHEKPHDTEVHISPRLFVIRTGMSSFTFGFVS